MPAYEALSLFDPIVQRQKPSTCPECGQSIKWARLLYGPVRQDIAIDPLPAGRTGDYRLLDDGTYRLKSNEDLATGATEFYMPHARMCRRSPF